MTTGATLAGTRRSGCVTSYCARTAVGLWHGFCNGVWGWGVLQFPLGSQHRLAAGSTAASNCWHGAHSPHSTLKASSRVTDPLNNPRHITELWYHTKQSAPPNYGPECLVNDRPLRVFSSRQEIRAFYNKISRVYDLLAERSEEPVRRQALASLTPQPGDRLLEVGFGTGHCLAAMAEAAGATGLVIGVDLSEGMAAVASQHLSRAGRVHLVCADALHLPLAPASLDGVFLCFTLELFDNPEIPLVLAECRRVLRPGGRLVVAGMSKAGDPGLALGIYEWSHRHFPNFVDCRPIYVRRALEAAGLIIEEASTTHLWVPVEIVRARKPV
jgi:ubiquinone/menaquinone biosynthesis C-methylase UbiE